MTETSSESRIEAVPVWHGRTVLITGGTSGTGLRSAEQFLARGANVVINGRDAGRGQEALLTLQEVSSNAALHLGDCAE